MTTTKTVAAVQSLIRDAYAQGNMRGHNATVEGHWSECTEDHANEWIAENAGLIEAAMSQGEPVAYIDERHLYVFGDATTQIIAASAAAVPVESERINRALDYLRPHLESGTFSAPDWAIQLASLLTGGDGCGNPVPVESLAHDALLAVIRACEANKKPCGEDPESPTAVRNGAFASIASIAAQGLGWMGGPSLSAPTKPTAPPAPVVPDDGAEKLREFARWAITEASFIGCDLDGGSIQEKAQRLGFLKEVKVAEPCSEIHCACADAGADFPAICCRFTDIIETPSPTPKKDEDNG